MSFFAELRRRHVVKVAIAYAIVAWLLVQVASILVPALRLPEWAMSFVVLIMIVGFPVALLLAWAFELTPVGVRRTQAGGEPEPAQRVAGRRLDFVIIGLLTIVLVFVAFDQYVIEESAFDAQPVSGVTEPSVAVLPFVSLSGDAEQAYFAEGVSEELLNALSRIPDLRVPSRTSSFSFAGTNTPLSSIAEQLDVTHVLEGSVRKENDQVRIRAQLIDAASNESLWAETFTRELTGIFVIQDEIAMRVAEALQLTLLGAPGQGLSRTENAAAHDAYLLGLSHVAKFVSADVLRAIESFERAIELDPQFAAAYAMLAHSYNIASRFDFVDDDDAAAAARAAVDRALELDPLLARAYYERSQLSDGLEARLADLQRATELGLNDSDAWLSRANALMLLGRRGEARMALEQASRLDPRSPEVNWRMGALRLNLGDRAGARGFYTRQKELDPANPTGYAGLGDVEMFEGRIDEA
ncbi:MAG TPA: hypothetical protein VKQ06_02620, partial [Gammaproteobacteria bacterium]|nr:hypothetical protein [Gammaproteobacteria bacterium]